MTAALQRARTFQELLQGRDEQDPYIYSSIFAAGTWRQRRLSKRKFRLLQRIDDSLRAMLEEGEQVYFVTRGCPISFWEYYAMGWAMYYLNQRAIVLTNRRILLLQITSRDRPAELRAQIDYRAIEEVKGTGLGNTRIRFRSGKSRVFTYIPKADRQFLRHTIGRLRKALGEAAPVQQDIGDLCPHCFQPASGETLTCDSCQGHFKSPRHAALLSLIFPGAGDFYLGHRGFAVLELLGALLLWLALAVLAWDPASSPIEFVMLVVLFVVTAHGVDAVTTRHIARKGLYPAAAAGGAARRYALAALVPVGALLLSIVPLSGKRGLTPLAGILPGDSLPARHVEALRRAGYLDPGESVVQFYSPGSFSILEGGSILSDRRVVTYGRDEAGSFVMAAPYEAIVDLHRDVPADRLDTSVLMVARDDGDGFWFMLPSSGGKDLAFQEVLAERWRAARLDRAEGVWYDGGAGSSADDAIVVRGLASGQNAADAERWWVTLWLGPEDAAWKWAERSELAANGRNVDRVVVVSPAGDRRTLFFDVSGTQ